MMQVDFDRYIAHTRKYYDTSWNELPFSKVYPCSSRTADKPENLQEMLDVASLLSRAFEFVRVDFYSNGKECFVGEITNCHDNAEGYFIPRSQESLASQIVFGG